MSHPLPDGDPPNDDRPAPKPLPVLPYSPGHDDVEPPAQQVFGQMGRLALVLALVSASCAIVQAVLGTDGSSWRPGWGSIFCFGLLPWLISITIAVRVSVDPAGRIWGAAALLIDLLLMLVVL